MAHDPETLTLQAAIEIFYAESSEGSWTEMFRLARVRAKADNMSISEALKAELVLRLKD